jgi:4-hydroxy-4-methyl-2-oxoglutarate aldolase
LHNKGFTDSTVHCVYPELPAAVGYAATARIRSSDPPMEGRSYYDRGAWWDSLLKVPAPRVVVVEDVDSTPGLGAFIGAVHANILLALGCVAVVTNGGVRDLPDVRQSRLQVFAGNVSVSHAYAHVFDFGGTVEIAGLTVHPGDLIHGDLHGLQTIPHEIAGLVPGKALEIVKARKELIAFCHSNEFSIAKLRERVKELES